MYSIDPKVYEVYKKSDKKTAGDSKKLKPVSGAEILSRIQSDLVLRACSCVCLSHVLSVLQAEVICGFYSECVSQMVSLPFTKTCSGISGR